MDLIQLVLILIGVGIVLYLINAFLPMDTKIKNLINIVVMVVVVFWVLSLFIGYLPHIRVGK